MVIRLFRQAGFSQAIEKVLSVFCTLEYRCSPLRRIDRVSWIDLQDLSCLGLSILQLPQLSVGRSQPDMTVLVVGRASRRFTEPMLGFTILLEQVMGFTQHQRCKMRMERIKAHLPPGELDCFVRFTY